MLPCVVRSYFSVKRWNGAARRLLSDPRALIVRPYAFSAAVSSPLIYSSCRERIEISMRVAAESALYAVVLLHEVVMVWGLRL